MKLLAHFLFLIRSDRVLILTGGPSFNFDRHTTTSGSTGTLLWSQDLSGWGGGQGKWCGGGSGGRRGGGDYKYGPSNRRLFLSNEP